MLKPTLVLVQFGPYIHKYINSKKPSKLVVISLLKVENLSAPDTLLATLLR